MERVRRDTPPGAETCAWAGTWPAGSRRSPLFALAGLVLRRRAIGRGLLFLELDPLRAARVRVQVVVRRGDVAAFADPPPAAARAPPGDFDAVSALCEQNSIMSFRVALGKSLTGRGGQGEPSVYARALEAVVRPAAHPAAIARLAAMAVGPGAVVPPPQAARALRLRSQRELEAVAAAPHQKLAALARSLLGSAGPRRSRLRRAHLSAPEFRALEGVEARALPGDIRVRELRMDPAAADAATLRSVDPSLNVPNAGDWRRLRYAETKKRPQVAWMVSQALAMLGDRAGSASVLDVGGGRGDLALALSAAGIGLVTVVDTNSPSLAAGRERAAREGLADRMRFIDGDASRVAFDGGCDLVVALHACGGLSELAVSIAAGLGASFLICTCCFSSNPSLACLTGDPETGKPRTPEVAVLRKLAEKQSQRAEAARAAAALNSIRLCAARQMYGQKQPGRRLETQQLAFDQKYSKANRVLYGLINSISTP
eukprot:m51a1_g11951 putative ubiquinone menaquinone biosynthesis methyltransferase (486) ;mRNA; r:753227-754684